MFRSIVPAALAVALTFPAQAVPVPPQDRAGIIDAITAIAAGADRAQWARVRSAFTETVTVDYTSLVGGQPATLKSADLVKSWEGFLPGFERTQHLVTNHTITSMSGNVATAEADFQATHRIDSEFWVLGGRYNYSLAKEGETWKVASMTMTWTWETGDRGLMAKAAERMKGKAN
jgi:hypothetical protein